MWRYALLEVYAPEDADEWPDGTPADWIEKELVGYCDGEPREYVLLAIPLRRLLWWAVADAGARIQRWLEQPVRGGDD